MARYIMLLNWTDQGVRAADQTVARAAAARKVFEKAGAKLVDISWTLGAYDIVITAEAPDDETMTALGLGLGKLGNLRSQTLRAFDENEMQRILKRM